MRRVVTFLSLILCLLFNGFELQAQNHVTWNALWDKNSNELVIKGTIDPSWHLYSPKTDPNLGPIALSVTFDKNKGIKKTKNIPIPPSSINLASGQCCNLNITPTTIAVEDK